MKKNNYYSLRLLWNNISLFYINYSVDQIGSKGSLFTPSLLNPADRGTGKSCTVQKNSQQSHLSQDPKEPHAPKWNDKAKGTALTLHVNHSDEQEQNNQIHQNLMPYPKGTVHCHLVA